MTTHLAEVREATEQLGPERLGPCRNAITMCSVMVDDPAAAHARPLDEPAP